MATKFVPFLRPALDVDLVGLRGQSRVNWIREGRLAECSEHPSSYGRATRNLHE
jgi:hypothetical protein